MARRLAAEELALWRRVVDSVRPLHASPPETEEVRPETDAIIASLAARPPPPPTRPAPPRRRSIGTTLDASWDRRLARGSVQPEMQLDLHGHNLATAYDILDRRLEMALAQGVRVLLLVTGKPPAGEPPVARGRIRAAVGDWLAASRHAGRIAAVRGAHPRHGGAGALYIVLRRPA